MHASETKIAIQYAMLYLIIDVTLVQGVPKKYP